MANNAFERTTIGLRERPVSSDLNRNMSQLDRGLRDSLQYLLSARSLSSAAGVPYTGFIGDGFRVVPTSPIGLSVQLTAGLGFFYTTTDLPIDLGALDLEGVDDRSTYKPMLLTAPQQFAVPAAPSVGNSRIDIIEARYERRLTDPQLRQQLDATSKQFTNHTFDKTLTFDLTGEVGTVNSPSPSTAALGYKIGATAPTGTEIEPSVTPGYVQVARINVGPTVTTIDANALVDRRRLIATNGFHNVHASWRWQYVTGFPASIVTALRAIAPPSVQCGLRQNTNVRGDGILAIVGGEIASAVLTPTLDYPTAAATFGSGWGAPWVFSDPSSGGLPTTVDSSIQSTLATMTPPIVVGVGSKVAFTQIRSRFQIDALSKDPSAALAPLEDIVLNIAAGLKW